MAQQHALNHICPYYTMFPLAFPQRVLRHARKHQRVVDSFCGRGTTLFAARERRLISYGTDTSPVAVTISRSKLTTATAASVLDAYDTLMKQPPQRPSLKAPFGTMHITETRWPPSARCGRRCLRPPLIPKNPQPSPCCGGSPFVPGHDVHLVAFHLTA